SKWGKNSDPMPSNIRYALVQRERTAMLTMTERWWTDHVKARRYRIVSHVSTGLCHSEVSFQKIRLAMTGAMVMENITAPSRANATVQAIGRNRRPSPCCSVKVGRYAVMMIVIA